MKLYTKTDNYTLYNDNMLNLLDDIKPNSIDSIVTDPPYELGFMSQSWDSSGIAFQKETWEKCFQVLKPGGHLLCFGGSRTFHRIACAIEDAGFEIRDTIMWIYGSGMPKGQHIGGLIDKKNGVNGEIIGYQNGQDFSEVGKQQKEILGTHKLSFGQIQNATRIDAPIFKASNEWDDWRTQLKPAYEPIIVARKPCEGTCMDNIQKYRVGALNIGDCRIPTDEPVKLTNRASRGDDIVFNKNSFGINNEANCLASADERGRFPSNVILSYDDDTEDEVCGGFPNTKSTGGNGEASKNGTFRNIYNGGWGTADCSHLGGLGDEGSAARYFYCAKTSAKDRNEGLDDFEAQPVKQLNATNPDNEDKDDVSKRFITYKRNIHPTVKPTELMQYLVKLVTPKNGTVLDPFNGSGSTGKACMWENKERNANYKYVGIELSQEYLEITKARLDYVVNAKATTKEQLSEQVKNSAKVGNRLLNLINNKKVK